MCLGCPGEVVSIDGMSAVIEVWGTQRLVQIESLDEPLLPGDFVIEHDGLVVRRIPADDVNRTLELYEAVLAEA